MAGLGTLMAGCSSAYNVVPQQADLAPIAASLTAPASPDIVVPMPVAVSLRSVSTPLAERRNGAIKIGKPYEVAGNWYYPAPGTGYDEEGVASWYGPDFQGKSTANGETYNMNRLTAAHPTLPMPCYVAVTNEENGRTVVVRINDRGPYKAGRIIDLSHRAAQLLAVTHAGTANVRVKYLKMAPLMADERFEQEFLARQKWFHGPQLAAAMPGNGQLRLATAVSGWQPDSAGSQ